VSEWASEQVSSFQKNELTTYPTFGILSSILVYVCMYNFCNTYSHHLYLPQVVSTNIPKQVNVCCAHAQKLEFAGKRSSNWNKKPWMAIIDYL
jgi:hypothetical protein